MLPSCYCYRCSCLKGLPRNDQKVAKSKRLVFICGGRDRHHHRHHAVDNRTFSLVSSDVFVLSSLLLSLMKSVLCPVLMPLLYAVLLLIVLLHSDVLMFVLVYSVLMLVKLWRRNCVFVPVRVRALALIQAHRKVATLRSHCRESEDGCAARASRKMPEGSSDPRMSPNSWLQTIFWRF